MCCVSGFQIKDGRWHQTHFVFHSLDPTLLPVVDIYNLPKTTPTSHYHLEVGPVCFLWGLQCKSFEHRGKDHHPSMTPSYGHGDRSCLLQSAAKHCPSENNPPRNSPASLCQTPIGLQTQREEAQGAGGQSRGRGRAEKEQGSSCTNMAIASSNSSRRISTCTPTWRKKSSMPHNLSGTLLSEGRPRPS